MTPDLTAAARRAPVRVHTGDGTTIPATLVAISAPRRGERSSLGHGRCKVQLPSGRYLSLPVWAVEVIG